MIQVVIIDVDDTLCLTESACFEMENDVLVRIGRPPMPRALHISTWGQPLFEAIRARSPGIDVDAFKRAYQQIIPEYVAGGKLDDIPAQNYQAIDALIKRGMRVMLLTSRTHDELKHMLAPDHLLAKRVTAFYYRDNMQYHKPDPRAFDDLLHANGLRPEDCVYVGDSPGDAKAANEAGLRFIVSLESGIRTLKDFEMLHLDAVIDSFPDIIDAIRTLDETAK